MIGTVGNYRIFRVSRGMRLADDLRKDLGTNGELCAAALANRQPVYAVYRKSRLMACYIFQKENHQLVCRDEWEVERLPATIINETDLCICRDLISILAWKCGWTAQFHNHPVTVNHSALLLQILEGLVFGAAMGLIVWLARRHLVISILIGCTWAAASVLLFLNHEIEKQKDRYTFRD
ncbi:hypothetical protein [Galactobacillus timonensis]|uniref:hypothetical protein n=1 Tax=Galactobacillus timonensis TaxID=2041840 RepID=UPI00240A7BB8|nr:hypothetical protein [Galactobacillus timonensis]MDD6680542.1 hypothetical protein [Galactobacillus timonensis]